MSKHNERNSLNQWCGYCKDELFDDSNFIVVNKVYYHLFCWKQRNTISDPFDDAEPED
jgi:hypothetical protein